MSVNPHDLLARLIERNPGVGKEELLTALGEHVADEPALQGAILTEILEWLYPIAAKIRQRKPLTEGEQAIWKRFEKGALLTKAEDAAAHKYVMKISQEKPHRTRTSRRTSHD
jgi:hypothetical protein